MKFAGHTMGTPDQDLYSSMKLFKEIGFDGIEIRCAQDGHLDTVIADNNEISQIRKWKKEIDIEITCLTPYHKDFVTSRRDEELVNIKKAIEAASELECEKVRVYGGLDPVPPDYTLEQDWERTAGGIREAAEYASPLGVSLCIETHIGSLTMSAHDTVKMVELVGMDNVGILFDFAWIYYAGKESIEQAVDLCLPYIFHCHYKDWVFNRETKEKKACLMGEGTVPWEGLFNALIDAGFSGSFTDEYEKYWNREVLPDAEIGMKQNLEYVQKLIKGNSDGK